MCVRAYVGLTTTTEGKSFLRDLKKVEENKEKQERKKGKKQGKDVSFVSAKGD